MKGTLHLTFGTASAVVISTQLFASNNDVLLFIGSAMFGSLLPDLDHKTSIISNKLPVLAFIVHRFFSRRGMLHTPLFIFLLSIFNIHILHFPLPMWSGLALGYLCHLIQDTFTKGGIMWLYPISKISIHFSNAKSGAISNYFVTIFLLCLIVGWKYIL